MSEAFNVFSDHWHCERCAWMRSFRGGWFAPADAQVVAATVRQARAAKKQD